MKKLLFTALALGLGVNLAIAQNNRSTINKVGDRNSATVNQEGEQNKSDIDLIKTGAGDDASDNIVSINQLGDYNNAEFDGKGQDFNEVDVDHDGNGHITRLTSEGDRNIFNVDVDGNIGGGQYSGNRSDWKVASAHPESPDDNTLTLTQDGFNNEATGSVDGDDNDVNILQLGSGNQVGSNWYTNDGVIIEGDRNSAKTEQYGTGNRVTQIQKSNDNTALAIQGASGIASDNNTAYQYQYGGDHNQAKIYQNDVVPGSGNTANQEQKGNYNHALIDQGVNPATINGFADQYQEGDNNTARIQQDGVDHYATLNQVGNGNEDVIDQASGQNNYATSSQVGNVNVSKTVQDGSNNESTVTIVGNHNGILAGNGLVEQYGDGNTSTLNIVGNNNEYSVSQQ